MKATVLSVCLLLLVSVLPAAAQTHPCDDPALTNQVVQTNGPISVGFCIASKDADGNPVALTSFRVSVDGTDKFSGPLTAIGAPNAAGLNYYETPKTIALAKGSHTAIVFASSVDGEGAGSDPFVYSIKGVPPGKPVIKKVVK